MTRTARIPFVIRFILALLWLGATPVFAQPFPTAGSTLVNDFADLLDGAAEAQLADDLKALRAQHGIEMTVVTIDSRSDYGTSASIEAFATGLFNAWGVGNAQRNDGIMVLVARRDREVRIELGSGYPPVWNAVAQTVIDDAFLRAFRDEEYQRGITQGTAEVIRRIARPFAAGNPEEVPANQDYGPLIAVMVGLVVVFTVARNWLGDLFARLRRCPQCGTRNRRRRRRTLRAATRTATGQRETTHSCTNCSYIDISVSVIPRRQAGSSTSGFGGGSSSGGGASGRW